MINRNNFMNNGNLFKLLLFILIAGLGLRVPISYIPPMSLEIMSDLKINHSIFGIITSLSPLCFFIFSPLAPYFEKRHGLRNTLILTFVIAIVAYLLRLHHSVTFLLISTVIFGFAIALGNIVLPSFFKSSPGSNIAILSAVYTASLYLGPAMATALTIPIKNIFGFSWGSVSLIWIFIPVLSILLILLLKNNKMKKKSAHYNNQESTELIKKINPWSMSKCWFMAIYFSALSFLFYIITAWFPELISSYGLSDEKSAFYASLFSLFAIPFAILTSFYIYKVKKQKIIFFINPLIVIVGVLILIFADKTFIPVAIAVMGIGSGICTGAAFLSPLLRFNHTTNITKANSMMQSIGYMIAFSGPIIAGYLHDLTHSWTMILWMIVFALGIQAICGIVIGKNEKLDS